MLPTTISVGTVGLASAQHRHTTLVPTLGILQAKRKDTNVNQYDMMSKPFFLSLLPAFGNCYPSNETSMDSLYREGKGHY